MEAPILEHSIAVALPMPEAAPVTKTILPESENGLYDISTIVLSSRY